MNSKIAIVTYHTFVSPWKENWEEQMETWIPEIQNLGIPVYSLSANPNVENYYEEVNKLILFKGLSKFSSSHDVTLSYSSNAALHWAYDQDLDYVLLVDNDTYVHPERFINLITEYEQNPRIKYAGACMPYWGVRGWWPKNNFQLFIEDDSIINKGWASGGAGILLNKEAIKIAKENFLDELSQTLESQWNDKILGTVLNKNGIHLYQDSRFVWESPHNCFLHTPDQLPLVTDKDSFVVCQHNMDGHMKPS